MTKTDMNRYAINQMAEANPYMSRNLTAIEYLETLEAGYCDMSIMRIYDSVADVGEKWATERDGINDAIKPYFDAENYGWAVMSSEVFGEIYILSTGKVLCLLDVEKQWIPPVLIGNVKAVVRKDCKKANTMTVQQWIDTDTPPLIDKQVIRVPKSGNQVMFVGKSTDVFCHGTY